MTGKRMTAYSLARLGTRPRIAVRRGWAGFQINRIDAHRK